MRLGRERSQLEGLKEWHAKAKNAVADYAWHMSVNGWNDRTADEIFLVTHEVSRQRHLSCHTLVSRTDNCAPSTSATCAESAPRSKAANAA